MGLFFHGILVVFRTLFQTKIHITNYLFHSVFSTLIRMNEPPLPAKACRYLKILVCIITLAGIYPGMGRIMAQTGSDSLLKQAKHKNHFIRIPKSDSLRLELQKKHQVETSDFYRKVKTTAHKNFFSRQFYPLLFRNPSSAVWDASGYLADTILHRREKDKIIRSIRIYKSGVFGSSVFDTTVRSDIWLDKALNNLHFNTRDAIIKSYLQFRENEPLNPVILADNERILRQSALFEDARFIVNSTRNNDSVDIILVIRDVFPIGFDLKVRDASSSSVRLYNRNILGLGQQLEQSFEINTDQSPAIYLSQGACRIRNIRRSFTDVYVAWQRRPGIRSQGIQILKPFISPETRLGGGINIRGTRIMAIPGSQESATTLDFTEFDFWGGYSSIINRFQSPAFDRSVLAITARYYNLNMNGSPSVVMHSLNPSVSVNRYITALSLIRSGYYRTNMVYGFGRTEDIPTGHLARLTFGYETGLLQSRYYSGIKIMTGKLLRKRGFVYSWIEGGGYWSAQGIADGVAGIGGDYISPLYKSGSFRIRSFGSLYYKTGINRNMDSKLLLKNSENTSTFDRFRLSGDQRITARIESVVFSPYYLMGFRFAAYAFAEAGMVAPQTNFILAGKMVPAVGIGLRIKNENLAFSTFQIGLTWYGRKDEAGRQMLFEFSDIPQINLMRFNIEAPEITGF